MSHRIFVNKLNENFRRITQNGKGLEYGLGVTSPLTESEEEEIKVNELYFTPTDLLDKKRKIQIIFDSFTSPAFFADGAVKIDKVQKYVTDLQLTQANIAGEQSVFYGFFSNFPSIFSGLLKSVREAGREDNAAPWKMTRTDFPNINGQAIENSPNRRSIERLYDDRGGFSRQNISTAGAIELLVRESLADALFCFRGADGRAITSTEHPGPRGNGSGDKWLDKDALKRHFPFAKETTGDVTTLTYVKALAYLKNYIDLIDAVIQLQDESLSRTPDLESAVIEVPIRITLSTANVNLFAALTTAARNVVEEKVLTFFDESREFKTILNFGEDRQYLAQSWRMSPSAALKNRIQLKLLSPLDVTITQEDNAFIGREIAKSIIDTIEFELGQTPDGTRYLRPMDTSTIKFANKNATVNNVTLTSLELLTGSSGVLSNNRVTYEDKVFRKWLTADFKSSELNIDFSDYKNFVHFGSARKRLETFSQKLSTIQELEIYTTGSVSSSVVGASLKALELENIIRNLDPYEQFLYFESASAYAYSGSAYWSEDGTEYNITGSWPKDVNNKPYSPSHPVVVNSWYPVQSGIATRYDEFNMNRLGLHLPLHIQQDQASEEFINLVYMVGHLFDNIKVYIDQFPNIYSTTPAPLEELTMDQVYEVATSFGVRLPNAYSLDKLQNFIFDSTLDSGRSLVAETWKRFLHSMIFLNKIKGTKTSTDTLLSLYGLTSPILQVKESSFADVGNYIKSDELTYGLYFSASLNSNIRVPFVSSSITSSTLQLRFIPTTRQSSSIVVGDNKWAIDIIPHPSSSISSYNLTSSLNKPFLVTPINKLEYGKIQIVSGSARTVLVTSSYFPIFGGDYTDIMLRSQSGDFTIIQTDGDQILYHESMSVNLTEVWNGTEFIYVGGSGSLKLQTFEGIVDEVNVWGETISDDTFVKQAYDPGSYYGKSYTSSYDNLYVHLSFSQPYASITQSAYNESPYSNVSIVSNLPTAGFLTSSYRRFSRTIKQYTPLAGTTIYTDKKVNVAPSPTFDNRYVDVNGSKILNRTISIKSNDDKLYTQGQNVVSFAISPTDFVNQTIIRSMGPVDVNNIIGSPRYIQNTEYTNLNDLNYKFKAYYNKTINPNQYIRFFQNLVKSPAEMAATIIPARAKLIDGIVIESPTINRNKTYLLRATKVDGTDTKELASYIAGSGSIDIGAYPFSVTYDMNAQRTLTSDILPLTGILDITAGVKMVPSTKSSRLPAHRRALQYLNSASVYVNNGSLVTSSLFDEGSSYDYLEALAVYAGPRRGVLTSPYPRNSFVGIPSSGSIPARIPSEDNTLAPLYDIPPRSDLTDVGTTTYFHKSNGIYSYDIYTIYKTPYLVKLDTTSATTLDRLYAKITLLDANTISPVGRETGIIPTTTYLANSSTTGTLSIANIASILGIVGQAGLRIRLYRDAGSVTADAARSFSESPGLNSGVLFDALLDGSNDVFPYTLIQTNDSSVYYVINNTTGTDITTSIEMYYFTYSPANSQPSGYLPRHYKFSRLNNIGLKRRNFLGTQNTDEIPPPGCPWTPCPPFDGRPSAEYDGYTTDETDDSSPDNTDIVTFGGGGYLDVSQ